METLGPDPELVTPYARLKTLPDYPRISVLRLQFPVRCWSDGAYVDQERYRLVKEALKGPLAGQFTRPVQWFYDPMAVTAFAGKLNERAIVYDCMDELAQFRFAPPEIKARERELLARADLVFTGGRRLYESKSRTHSNCHFYGCGVDVDHFGRARSPDTAPPAELASSPGPILGYFGVIDERIDYELIARLADADPNWTVVLVGPVVKVDENLLPRRPNLRWLGRREYADLPACARAFDVCLMPFALNEATEYINPTKSLEYMATGRMIVSTAVPDVVSNFGSIVKVAGSPDEFVALCRSAVNRPDEAAIAAGLRMAAANTWDNIVAELEKHVLAVLPKGAPRKPKKQTPIAHGAF